MPGTSATKKKSFIKVAPCHVGSLGVECRILPRLFHDSLFYDVEVGDGPAVGVGVLLLAVALQRRDDVQQDLVVAED